MASECPIYYQKYFYPIVSVLVLIWIPICAIGNLLVLLAVLKKKYLQTQANYILINVAIADLLVTVVLQPIDYMYYANFPVYPHSVTTTLVWNSFFYSLLTASVYSLSVLSLERLLAIRYPLRYKDLVTNKSLSIVLIMIWLYAGATFIIVYVVQDQPPLGRFDYIVPDGFYAGLITVNFLLPLSFMMMSYFYIFKVARRHRRQISFVRLRLRPPSIPKEKGMDDEAQKESQCNVSDGLTSDKEMSTPPNDVEHNLRKISRIALTKAKCIDVKTNQSENCTSRKPNQIYRRSFSLTKELKTARLFAVVLLCFVLFWSPFLIYQFLFITDSIVFTCPIEFGDQVVSWITYLNSGVNVLVYGAMSRDFRRAYRSILQSVLCCRNIKTAKPQQIV